MSVFRRPVIWLTELAAVRGAIERTRPGRAVAGRFVAGASLEDGIRAAGSLRGRGIASILDHLGENVDSPAQASEATDAYIRALERLHESPGLDGCISVKLTQLGLDQGVDLCRDNMLRVLKAASAAEPRTLVMIDMESRGYVDRTLDLYLSLRDDHPDVGVALQACLLRTDDDVERIGGPGAIVRMTKGAYLEPPEFVHRTRAEVSASFARASRRLLERGSTVHFATHDPRLVDGARGHVHRKGLPPDRYEFQMLFGIRRDLQGDLVAAGEPVRVYIPYGTRWYPYLTRRMAERPANMWFFLSNLIRWRR
jgi:proline dehydrogenase